MRYTVHLEQRQTRMCGDTEVSNDVRTTHVLLRKVLSVQRKEGGMGSIQAGGSAWLSSPLVL